MMSRDHRAAVERRLALLRPETGGPAEGPAADELWWSGHTVVSDAEPERPADQPPSVPVPGRHASRRRISLLPEALAGRIDLGPWQVAVVALVLAAALGGTAWSVARARPSAPVPRAGSATGPLPALASSAPALMAASTGASAGTTTGAGASPAAAASVTVDVSGQVRHPGVRILAAGSRVVDAIAAAGGPRRGVNLSSLNQAQVLVDGEQIIVGGQGAPAATTSGGAGSGGAGGAASGGPVNLNTATVEELDTLPDVGPVTAQAIVSYREQHGPFTSVNQLMEIQGIGEKTLADIAPQATV